MKLFNIGDTVYVATVQEATERTQVICPDCRGARKLKVTLGDDSTVLIDCEACSMGWMGSQGFKALRRIEPHVKTVTITRIEIVKQRGIGPDEKVTYWSEHYGYDSANVFDNPEWAREAATLLAYDARKKEEENLFRKDKPTRTWASNVAYHRKEIREAEKRIEYHSKKLGIAREKAKEDKA